MDDALLSSLTRLPHTATPDELPDPQHGFASPLPPNNGDPSLPQPFPSPLPTSESLDIPTPLLETGADLSFAGVALPNHVALPAPPIVKNPPNLRLPSFDLLGIAAPHPDRKSFDFGLSFSSLGAGPLSKPEDPLHVLSPPLARIAHFDGSNDLPSPPAATSKSGRDSIQHPVSVVTPPTEPGTLNWGSFMTVRPAGLGSPPSSEPGVSPNLTNTASATNTLGPSSNIVVPIMHQVGGALGMAVCKQQIKELLVTESQADTLSLVKILSHALPCPSMSGHLFGEFIAFLHDRNSANTSWINVFHAVPGRFTLSDLPKSPPSTPGPAVGGDEYFTSKIFDSAVAIPDYQLQSKLLHPLPRPVVPPSSVHISIVERYIPPTNKIEYAEIFLWRGRSLLRDRLIELVSDNGLLLFIYPTKTGARTFMDDYLGPVLDPLLRTLTVVHDLASDLGGSLGQMSSVAHLDEYETLKSRLEQFCLEGSSVASEEPKPVYKVIHASKVEVDPARQAWANDWWIKQEKPRIRDTITKYFRQTKKLPGSGMTGTHLIEEVLDGVANRKIDDEHRTKGIEVGVFMIKKTK